MTIQTHLASDTKLMIAVADDIPGMVDVADNNVSVKHDFGDADSVGFPRRFQVGARLRL